MSDFDALENRLTRAAEEVRQASRTVTPPPAPGTRPRAVPAAKGWLVFAGAFALVALAIGVLPLFDRGTGAPVASPSTTVPVEPPSTDAPVAECSATGVPAPGAQEGLPENVAAKRQAIIDAAVACDFEALEALLGRGRRGRGHRVRDPAVLRHLHPGPDLGGGDVLHLPVRHGRHRPAARAPVG